MTPPEDAVPAQQSGPVRSRARHRPKQRHIEPVQSTPTPTPPPAKRSTRPAPSERKETSERQWHELAGSGRSQLSRGATIRARDADRPTAAELAEAERQLLVQRRNWTPPPH